MNDYMVQLVRLGFSPAAAANIYSRFWSQRDLEGLESFIAAQDGEDR